MRTFVYGVRDGGREQMGVVHRNLKKESESRQQVRRMGASHDVDSVL